MSKTVVILTALLLIATQGKSRELTGSWKEVNRMDLDGRPVSYSDTFFMTFNDRADQYNYRKGNWRFGTIGHTMSYIQDGNVVYDKDGYPPQRRDDNVLFTIVASNGNTLVIKNNTFIREFTVYKDVGDALPEEARALAVPSLSLMKGHWSEFKRESIRLKEVDYTRLIKFMDIYETYKQGNYGYVFATRDADTNPSWKIDSYDAGTQVLHCSALDPNNKKVYSRDLKVVRCEDNELRLEEEGIVYYFRKFKMFVE